MTKSEYEEFSVRYQCIEIQHERDIAATEAAPAELYTQYRVNGSNYDAFGELSEIYQQDSVLVVEVPI